MTRPTKPNPTPVANFNLRTAGPLKPADIQKRLGAGFRMAQGHGDKKATLDKDPCPHCNAPVEWAATSTTHLGKVVQYVYARCQGKQKHSWGFSDKKSANKSASTEVVIGDPIPPPRPSAGAEAMAKWIDKQAVELDAKVKALEDLKRAASYLLVGPPRPSPNHHKH